MTSVLYLIDDGDVFSLVVLISILAFVGGKMTERNPSIKQWGWRFAALAFVTFSVCAASALKPIDARDWLRISIRGLIAAGLALGLSWIALAFAAFVWKNPFASLTTRLRARAASAIRRREEAEQRRLHEEQLRARAQYEAQQRFQQSQRATIQAEAQCRRTDARANAVLVFSLFAPKLRKRFTRQMLDEFVAKFMGDEHPPEDVERRGAELVQTLQRHADEAEPPEEKKTLEDLARWYKEQKERIEAMPIEDRLKRQHVAELSARYAELSSRLLENLQP